MCRSRVVLVQSALSSCSRAHQLFIRNTYAHVRGQLWRQDCSSNFRARRSASNCAALTDKAGRAIHTDLPLLFRNAALHRSQSAPDTKDALATANVYFLEALYVLPYSYILV
jgi:hypothetical protein